MLTLAYPDPRFVYRGHFIREIALFLAETGYRVTVVTPKIAPEAAKREQDGLVEVRRFGFLARGKLLSEYKRVPVLKMLLFFASGLAAIIATVRSRRSMLIYSHWVIPTGLLGVLAGRLLRLPVVVSAHGSDVHTWGRKRLLRNLLGYTVRRAGFCVANSQSVKQELIRCGAKPEKTETIYASGVDIDLFHPDRRDDKLRRNLGYHPEHLVVCYGGNLEKVKGVDLLVDAFNKIVPRLPHSRLLIVGDGSEKEGIVRRVNELGFSEKVRFTGRVLNPMMSLYFGNCDIAVLPSLKEGLGVAAAEAMSCGVPVVVSRAGGLVDVVEDGVTGFAFATGNVDELADKLVRLLQDAGLRGNMGAAARRRAVERFSRKEQKEKVLKVVRDLTRNSF